MTQPKLIQTKDGSHTLMQSDESESYHSQHGAIQESSHIFIKEGLHEQLKNRPNGPIKILEIGFGTGLNALLTFVELDKETPLHYTGIEPYPIPESLWSKLNYPEQLTLKENLMPALHQDHYDTDLPLSKHQTLFKTQDKHFIEKTKRTFNLVYYDAFSPDTAPELWTTETFKALYKVLEPQAILVTYCVKGSVKQALRDAGFTVKRLPGPPGKRHCLRAIKNKRSQ